MPEHEHLTPTTSERGFKCMPTIVTHDGDTITVYESSNMDGPRIWLAATEGTTDLGGRVELSAEEARRLREQIDYLLEHHHQGDARP